LSRLTGNGWTLAATSDGDIDKVMTWLPDAASVKIWGGPNFRFPFTQATFREDCRLDMMDSFSLRNANGELAAFGQAYERDGRGHLARLISNPDYEEYSLFVYRDNIPAYQCYLSLGFVVQNYPEGAPMPDKCYFLTRQTTRRQ
jgi:hypothetical protein